MRSFIISTLLRILLGLSNKRFRWAMHVERVGEMRKTYKTLVRKPEGTAHMGDIGVCLYSRIILNLVRF
jgi:hypothetical protein